MRNLLKNEWIKEYSNGKIINELKMSFTQSELKLLKIFKRLDIFDLGFMLLNCALGGLEFEDLQTYQCEHIDKNNENIFTCCCLFHCINKYESSLPDKKLKLTNIINTTNYSEEFISFLCYTTSYKFDKNFTFHKIKNHDWFKTDSEKILISMDEVLKLSKDYYLKNDYLINKNNANRRFEKFCESLINVLSLSDNYFKYMNITNSDAIFSNHYNIDELSSELGVTKDNLMNKLKSIYDNLFENKN